MITRDELVLWILYVATWIGPLSFLTVTSNSISLKTVTELSLLVVGPLLGFFTGRMFIPVIRINGHEMSVRFNNLLTKYIYPALVLYLGYLTVFALLSIAENGLIMHRHLLTQNEINFGVPGLPFVNQIIVFPIIFLLAASSVCDINGRKSHFITTLLLLSLIQLGRFPLLYLLYFFFMYNLIRFLKPIRCYDV